MLNDGRELEMVGGESWLGVKTASPFCVGGEGRGGWLAPVISSHSISTVCSVLGTVKVAGTWLSRLVFLCIVCMWLLREDFLAVAYSQLLHLCGFDPACTLLW